MSKVIFRLTGPTEDFEMESVDQAQDIVSNILGSLVGAERTEGIVKGNVLVEKWEGAPAGLAIIQSATQHAANQFNVTMEVFNV